MRDVTLPTSKDAGLLVSTPRVTHPPKQTPPPGSTKAPSEPFSAPHVAECSARRSHRDRPCTHSGGTDACERSATFGHRRHTANTSARYSAVVSRSPVGQHFQPCFPDNCEMSPRTHRGWRRQDGDCVPYSPPGGLQSRWFDSRSRSAVTLCAARRAAGCRAVRGDVRRAASPSSADGSPSCISPIVAEHGRGIQRSSGHIWDSRQTAHRYQRSGTECPDQGQSRCFCVEAGLTPFHRHIADTTPDGRNTIRPNLTSPSSGRWTLTRSFPPACFGP